MVAVAWVLLLLFSSITFTSSSEPIKILIDESRVFTVGELSPEIIELAEALGLTYTKPEDPRHSFENYVEGFGYGTAADELKRIASVHIKKSGKISYDALKTYDILVIAAFEESYTSAEADTIKKFVENGGGLLFLVYDGSEYSNISLTFGVKFYPQDVSICDETAESADGVTYFYITDFASHPVTEGIRKVALKGGVPIASYESGEVLARTSGDSWADRSKGDRYDKDEDEDSGPFDVLLAMEIGRGRALFFGGSSSFTNSVLEDSEENADLLGNAVKWLGEPGGPYKQYKALNQQAQNVLSEAQSLFEDNNFSQAKNRFESALELFEESSEIYPNPEADKGIAEAESYIPACETGIKAENAFDRATELFNSRKYEEAIREYEKAQALYQEIECTEKIQACTTKIEESNALAALQDEATQLFSKGEDALVTAPSTFSTAGYEEARSLFEQAKQKWEEYNDSDKVAACNEKITYCTNEIARIGKTRIMIIAVIVGAIIVVVVVVVVVTRKRTSKAPRKAE